MSNNQNPRQDRIAELEAALAAEKSRNHELQMSAKASALVNRTAEEVPTGKTIIRKVCVNPAERNGRLKYEDREMPTFMYNIQLPAGAGISLRVNGTEYYHGQSYELDQYQLADIKSMVARTWDHEKSIHGENENAYRKPTHVRFG